MSRRINGDLTRQELGKAVREESLPLKQLYAEALPKLHELENEYWRMKKEITAAAAGKTYTPRSVPTPLASTVMANRFSLARARNAYLRRKARDAARYIPVRKSSTPAKKETA